MAPFYMGNLKGGWCDHGIGCPVACGLTGNWELTELGPSVSDGRAEQWRQEFKDKLDVATLSPRALCRGLAAWMGSLVCLLVLPRQIHIFFGTVKQ